MPSALEIAHTMPWMCGMACRHAQRAAWWPPSVLSTIQMHQFQIKNLAPAEVLWWMVLALVVGPFQIHFKSHIASIIVYSVRT